MQNLLERAGLKKFNYPSHSSGISIATGLVVGKGW
jgi:hypothetical protein